MPAAAKKDAKNLSHEIFLDIYAAIIFLSFYFRPVCFIIDIGR
uniref:Uncharacterized protein n=1 Tax=uncultured bacterium contig00021 TaxID=1181511 RepID=A0A806K299_9BACT|nr:hypothetical protein [uncultured bacterium contig00021]